jgi:hypothetical protein
VRGPNIVFLPFHRADPVKWGPELDRLTAGSLRIWVVGSHFGLYGFYVLPDWQALLRMLQARHYQIVETHTRPGAELLLLRPSV